MPTDLRAGEHLGADRMIDLVHGLLAPSDARAAVAHISSCRLCERGLQEQAGTFERARAAVEAARRPSLTVVPGGVADAMAAGLAEHPATLAMAPPAPARRWDRVLAWGVGVAAAACVVTAVLLPSSPADRLASNRPWLPDPGDQIIVRDGNGEAGAGLRDGLLAYARRDLATAERLLESAAAPGPGDQLRRLYLADLMLRTGRATEALDHLRNVRMSELPEPWGSQARWMLLAAYRGAGDRSRADSLQRALASNPGAPDESAGTVTPTRP